jgi:uncharacterized protein DUF4386
MRTLYARTKAQGSFRERGVIDVSVMHCFSSSSTPRGSDLRTKGSQLNPQKIARIVGWLFIATFVTGIGARLLFVDGLGATWSDMRFIPGAVGDTRMYFGAILEFLVIATNIGTAVVLYPMIKRQSEIGAVGYVTARVVECTFILVGLLSLLSVVTLRSSGADAGGLFTAGNALVETYNWAFLFGPGLVAGLGNGILLGYLMYRSNLVPRRMAILGLIGGPLLAAGFVGVMFGAFEPGSGWQGAATAFEFVWELSLGIYLIVKGFRPSAVTSLQTPVPAAEPSLAAA